MPRYLCKQSITGDRVYKAGDVIELTEKQAAQLLEIEAVESAPEPKKAEPPKSTK